MVQLYYDPNDWISKATAVVVGASLMSVGWALWPQLQRADPKATRRGLVLGMLGAGMMLALLRFACHTTQICTVFKAS